MLDSTLPEKRTALAKWETELIARARNSDTRVTENAGSTLGADGNRGRMRNGAPKKADALTGNAGVDSAEVRLCSAVGRLGSRWLAGYQRNVNPAILDVFPATNRDPQIGIKHLEHVVKKFLRKATNMILAVVGFSQGKDKFVYVELTHQS
jgi:hypothetical protein